MKKHWILLICISLILPQVPQTHAAVQSTVSSSETQLNQQRLIHAKELLGKTYPNSIVKKSENIASIQAHVLSKTKKYLPKKYRSQAKQIAQTILDSSLKNQLDPIFVMAVIMSESSFNPKAVGGVGEIGLMQIRPETAKWIAQKYKLPWKNAKTLFDPRSNIRIGTTYLAHLRSRFDSHAQLYVAAYNMGQGNVKRKMADDIWPTVYPRRVMANYVAFYKTIVESSIL